MSIFYKKIQRENPLNREIKKWYISLKNVGIVKSKEVAKQMADENTLNPKEAEMSVYQQVKVTKRLLLSGYSVQFDDLGTFYLTGTSSGTDTEEELTVKNLTKINIRFRPCAEFKAEIEKAQLKHFE